MSQKTPKSLAEQMFRPGSSLEALARRAGAAGDLTDRLRRRLPAELAAGLRSASVRDDGTLVLMTVSPAWAARLRFEGERLLSLCAGEQPAPTRLKVRVGSEAGS